MHRYLHRRDAQRAARGPSYVFSVISPPDATSRLTGRFLGVSPHFSLGRPSRRFGVLGSASGGRLSCRICAMYTKIAFWPPRCVLSLPQEHLFSRRKDLSEYALQKRAVSRSKARVGAKGTGGTGTPSTPLRNFDALSLAAAEPHGLKLIETVPRAPKSLQIFTKKRVAPSCSISSIGSGR